MIKLLNKNNYSGPSVLEQFGTQMVQLTVFFLFLSLDTRTKIQILNFMLKPARFNNINIRGFCLFLFFLLFNMNINCAIIVYIKLCELVLLDLTEKQLIH